MVMIEFCEYCKVIKKKVVLENINFTFESGKIYKLEGPNGSGKTMLLRAIAGLIYPSKGKLIINETDIRVNEKYPVKVGALIENPAFWKNYTGFEILKYLASIRGETDDVEIKEYMKIFGLDPDDKRTVGKYSLGMKQKLGIVQAIMEKPDIVLLDEPINALDSKAIQVFTEMVKKEKESGAVVIIAIHNEGDLNLEFDKCIRIEEGRIVNEY